MKKREGEDGESELGLCSFIFFLGQDCISCIYLLYKAVSIKNIQIELEIMLKNSIVMLPFYVSHKMYRTMMFRYENMSDIIQLKNLIINLLMK